jgi:hypothetical protein
MMCNIIDRARKSCSATNVALTKSPSKILLNSGAEDTDFLTEMFVVEHNFLTTPIYPYCPINRSICTHRTEIQLTMNHELV